MQIGKTVYRVKEVIGCITKWFYICGVSVIIVMMLLTVTDVLLRWLFNMPILGAYEMTEYIMVILVFSALAYTETVNGHVKVDFLVNHFSPRVQAAIDSTTHLIGVGVISLIAWRNVVQAYRKWSVGEITGSLPIPIYPLHLIIAVGSIFFCLALLIHFLESAAKVVKR